MAMFCHVSGDVHHDVVVVGGEGPCPACCVLRPFFFFASVADDGDGMRRCATWIGRKDRTGSTLKSMGRRPSRLASES